METAILALGAGTTTALAGVPVAARVARRSRFLEGEGSARLDSLASAPAE